MTETGAITKRRGETTSEVLINAGLPDTRWNRILCNFSGLLCWAFLFCWFPLLIGQPHRPVLLALVEIPLIFVVPGFLYLLTVRLWPAFAIIQMQFIRLIGMLSILWLPMGILIGVMNNQVPAPAHSPISVPSGMGGPMHVEVGTDFWAISGFGLMFLIYLFIASSIVRLSRRNKGLTDEARKRAITHLVITSTVLTWVALGILFLTAHYGRELKHLAPLLLHLRMA